MFKNRKNTKLNIKKDLVEKYKVVDSDFEQNRLPRTAKKYLQIWKWLYRNNEMDMY